MIFSNIVSLHAVATILAFNKAHHYITFQNKENEKKADNYDPEVDGPIEKFLKQKQ